MSNFPILDFVIGIVFIYFLLSIICSSIVEIALTIQKARARVLEAWLLRIFDTQIRNAKGATVALGKEILEHCAVTALSNKTGNAPSYIDAKNFVSALIEKVTSNSNTVTPKNIDELITSLNTTTALSNELKQSFLIYANEARDTFNALTEKTIGAMEMFRSKLENWYDTNMDRITGTMKALYVSRFTMATAIAVSIVLNADTISISKYLYNNDEARAKVAAKAFEIGSDEKIKNDMDKLKNVLPNDSLKLTVDQLKDTIDTKLRVMKAANAALSESIPIGWSSVEFAVKKSWDEWLLYWFLKLIGIAMTILAIMMGAPFWFDVLNKVSNLRGTGPKPASSTDNDFNKPK